MATQSEEMTIGKLSKRTGCNIETIRYYERIDLLFEPPRTSGGYRIYDADDLKRLTFIRRSRELGFTLEQVRQLLSLVDGGDYTCAEVKAITLAHLNDIQQKIICLKNLEGVLVEIVSQCDRGTIPDCPLIDALFQERM